MVDRGVSGCVLRNVDECALVDCGVGVKCQNCGVGVKCHDCGVGVKCRDCGVDERDVM